MNNFENKLKKELYIRDDHIGGILGKLAKRKLT
jgi:hypothetical protein